MKQNRLLLCFLLLATALVFLRCGGGKSKAHKCVYEIVAAEGTCPPGTQTKSFCAPCRTPCPTNLDTTIISGNDTCRYTLRVIDKNCRSCPPNSLP